ncbi:hypothetical protein RUND412_002662 [Rhizina undulata]
MHPSENGDSASDAYYNALFSLAVESGQFGGSGMKEENLRAMEVDDAEGSGSLGGGFGGGVRHYLSEGTACFSGGAGSNGTGMVVDSSNSSSGWGENGTTSCGGGGLEEVGRARARTGTRPNNSSTTTTITTANTGTGTDTTERSPSSRARTSSSLASASTSTAAGPSCNLADDPHARRQEGSWLAPLQATCTKIERSTTNNNRRTSSSSSNSSSNSNSSSTTTDITASTPTPTTITTTTNTTTTHTNNTATTTTTAAINAGVANSSTLPSDCCNNNTIHYNHHHGSNYNNNNILPRRPYHHNNRNHSRSCNNSNNGNTHTTHNTNNITPLGHSSSIHHPLLSTAHQSVHSKALPNSRRSLLASKTLIPTSFPVTAETLVPATTTTFALANTTPTVNHSLHHLFSPTSFFTLPSISIDDKKLRLPRHRRSRDLSHQRRSFNDPLSAYSPFRSLPSRSKMNDHHHHHLQLDRDAQTSTLEEILGYPTSANAHPLSPLDKYPTSPRPPSSSTRSEYIIRSPFSLSAENLHSQYAAVSEGITLQRPHSMSSLQQQQDSSQFPLGLRRASDPSDIISEPANQFTNEFEWTPTSLHGTSFEESIERTPVDGEAQQWWDESKVDMDDDWARHEAVARQMHMNDAVNVNVPSRAYSGDVNAHSHVNVDGNLHSDVENQYSMYLLRNPPSPAMDGENSYIKRSASSNSSMPSPPESPGFFFSTVPSQLTTPEIGYPTTPAMSQGAFPYYAVQPRRSSIPPTPPSRPPSTSTSSAIAAAAAALASTQSKKKTTSRPGSSRRKASNSSMRSQTKGLANVSNEEMSFVNFTPNDATRILNGVAPSGSSKTKARREREALEKRRKLSEAAQAAVLAAGGDTSLLAKVDLL